MCIFIRSSFIDGIELLDRYNVGAMFYFLAFNSGNAFRCLCALIQARNMAVDLLTLGAV